MVKSIYLQDGEEIFVDDEDYERVNQYTWSKAYSGNSRFVVNIHNVSLNNFVLDNSFQMVKNNNFSKNNLTLVGSRGLWRRPKSNSSSKYKGVCWDKSRKKWRADINVNKKTIFLGSFIKEADAGRAYNEAVYKFYKGKAFINDIGMDNRIPIKQYKTHKNQNNTRGGRSGYKGVYQSQKNKELFEVCISFSKKTKFVSTFKNIEQAALVYNKCIYYLYGEDAILNDVTMTDELKEFISYWEIPDKIKDLKEGDLT